MAIEYILHSIILYEVYIADGSYFTDYLRLWLYVNNEANFDKKVKLAR